MKHLKIYWSKVFVRVPDQLRKSKWDDKAKLGILLGYTETGYKILIDNKVINARHVDVIEGVKCIGLFYHSEENSDQELDNKSEQSEDKLDSQEIQSPSPESSNKSVRKSNRNIVPNKRYFNEDFETNFVYVNYCDANVPNTFEGAIESQESDN